ncbi:toxin-antitoxin system YwqK family antitoxin [Seonamhaeicola marinus]|uniref:Toxin-antitoxin system YwqK family antitoxin n=1 Tax=Seonamhaeicola marinus TaxID=1912246 RepID=A0A5D0HT66_9FLAO|nr:toxin-antitoxin system YwqK family antitoxin [Seonamhaeicola marinus]TYA74241.1 toxin-antitoxin system YwqK family antitoxin [Seonamhaeicola marinus]
MKSICFLLLTVLLFSCKDDISNKRYRNENYVFYQENGKEGEWLKINPDLKIQLPKSFSTYFFPNGNKYAEVEVIDSFPNRIVKCYDLSNRLTHINIYELDSLIKSTHEDGYFYSYHSNHGLLKSEGQYENNMQQGKWMFYREDGITIKQIVEYIDDTLHGVREDYWENGNIKSKTFNIKGKQNGTTYHYHQNGGLQETLFLKDNLAHGKSTRFYENGNLQAECQYWNDIPKDTCKFYFDDKTLKGIQITNLDTATSKYSQTIYNYHKNGQLKQSFKKVNEHYDGSIKVYYENGNLSHDITFINGKREGYGYEYFENGNIKFKAFYVNDLIEGEMQEFDEKGKLIKTHIAENGEEVDIIIH